MLEVLEKDYGDVFECEIGLTQAEAERRLKENGANALAPAKKKSALLIFTNQFHDIMTLILLVGAGISVLIGERYDALTIAVIVLLNALLGFIQEFKTEKTLEALEKMTAPSAKVWRDGNLTEIPATRLVKGDIFELEAGDRVPCDAFILNARSFMCDEAMLTGESVAVEKSERNGELDFNALNLPYVAYMGTIVTKGTARCEAVSVGTSTQMGAISSLLSGISDELTPLQKKLGELGRMLAFICLGVCVAVFLAGILRGEPFFDMLMTGITIAIAAIPEGLPATVTIALAIAVRKMLKKNALVHRLHSVETLGCASVICTDKTGTITENKMTVTRIVTATGEFEVLGSGYRESGEIRHNGKKISASDFAELWEALLCCTICNNSRLSRTQGSSSRNRGVELNAVGDPTELAMLTVALKGGIVQEKLWGEFKKLDEIPFESETRIMSVIAKTPDGRTISYTKGAPDVVIAKCTSLLTTDGIVLLTPKLRERFVKKNDELAGNALRVLAVSESVNGAEVLIGLVGMIDPLRSEAKRAIATCSRANIRTVMITGDHKLTACCIAKQAGIMKDGMLALTGRELASMSDERLSEVIEQVAVFARVNPTDKLRIVRILRKKGHICAMTGDGVNDCPAIKEADIGVSMGITGTDVTKQTADVILLDDNFASLVDAVEQGRTIYANIRKFVRYLISCNIGEVITMFVGILMGLPIVLLPTQILLVNLVTDGLPAVSLGLEPCERSIMQARPRKSDDSFFSDGLLTRIIFRGILIGLGTLASFVGILRFGGDVDTARTASLFTLVVSQLIHVFECKSESESLFRIPIFNNIFLCVAVFISLAVLLVAIYIPQLAVIFSTVPLGFKELLIAIICAVTVPILAGIAEIKAKK